MDSARSIQISDSFNRQHHLWAANHHRDGANHYRQHTLSSQFQLSNQRQSCIRACIASLQLAFLAVGRILCLTIIIITTITIILGWQDTIFRKMISQLFPITQFFVVTIGWVVGRFQIQPLADK